MATNQNTGQLKDFLQSATTRLALTYLAIIMLMSIGFSVVFYNTSYNQLGRQLPPDSLFETTMGDAQGGRVLRRESVTGFLEERINQGRIDLLNRLIWINILTLIAGAILSYFLARASLRPIEEAMDSQSRFVSDASHELRTPITALQLTNEVALRKPKLSIKEARDLLLHNVEEATKLRTLSDTLLGLLKQDNAPLTVVPVKLQDVVTESLNQIVGPATAKKLKLHDKIPKLKILADKHALIQVVTILLDNAVKYSHEKGHIYVAATKHGKQVHLSVKDEGIGIHASDLPHIFDRFYRADRSRSKLKVDGYGLGLSIAKKITDQHHGSLQVESEPGKGATFILTLSSTDATS